MSSIPFEKQPLASAVAGEENPADSWSEADKAWLEHVPPALRQIAVRFGRDLFSISMQAGATSVALGQIAQMMAGNRRVGMNLQVVQRTMDDFCKRALFAAGKTPADLKACQADIELMAQLAENEAQAGRIILPN